MNIQEIMDSLARMRPVFHNEADFQHALAWELRERYECKIRLEQRMEIDPKRRTYLDILLEKEGRRTAIELKYKMRAIDYMIDGEKFSLANQGAQDIGRYDVLKDLQRLEQMVNRNLADEGYLIYLTNDASYYQDPGIEKSTADREFRIHEGRVLTGVLAWSENAGEGTMKGREEAIVLEGSYEMNWRLYSQLDQSSAGSMKSLIVPVQSKAIPWVIKSIDTIPISQFDLRDKLVARLREKGYQVQINREFGHLKVDIEAESGNDRVLIEVRYKTALLQTHFNGAEIHLKKHAAYDISRYDFLSDLAKLEKIVAHHPDTRGFAVLVTNDRNYWEEPIRETSVDEEFKIHQNRMVQGRLNWKNASDGTTLNREEAIELSGQYRIQWHPFLTLGTGKNEQFQMLAVEVIRQGAEL